MKDPQPLRRLAIGICVFLSLVVFLADSVVSGWVRLTTDFPNYYTAAVLVRKGEPLRRYYDWAWFQRQMNVAGIERQLGGYIPQTPLTMVPLIPLSGFSHQRAKQLWLMLNLGFLAFAILLLSRITNFGLALLWLLTFAGYGALQSNVLLGQYYVFLLLLLTTALYCLLRNRSDLAGASLGTAFMLKLYGGPFVLLLAAKRRWHAAIAMIAACLCFGFFAIVLFGWNEVAYYSTQVLPRALQGQTLDPYHPGNGTFSTLLRRTFIAEPELNPHPLLESPQAFFFLQPLFSLTILILPVIALSSKPGEILKREFAWFVIAILLISPNTALYTFILLVLPVAMLLEEATAARRIWILLVYVLLTMPLWPAWNWLFPKMWLLLILYVEAGRGYWGAIRPGLAIATGVAIVLVASVVAARQVSGYRQEPGRRFARLLIEPGAIYSAAPAMSKDGLIYESINQERYLLLRFRSGKTEVFSFEGEAFHPAAADSGGSIYFELVARGISRIAMVDPATRQLSLPPQPVQEPREPAVSHDGKALVVVSDGSLWLSDGSGSRKLPIPGTVRNPSFIPGDRQIVFSAGPEDRARIALFDLDTKATKTIAAETVGQADPVVSPNGRWLASTSRETGTNQVWVEELSDQRRIRITGGNCNSFQPTWTADSQEIIFASDCGRGLGLPALYRARVDSVL